MFFDSIYNFFIIEKKFMLILQLLIWGVAFILIGLFMLYKKKAVLAIFFILMGIIVAAVAVLAMYMYPEKSVF